MTISDYIDQEAHIDDADLAVKTFSDFMEIADRMGTILNEGMETEMLSRTRSMDKLRQRKYLEVLQKHYCCSYKHQENHYFNEKREIREAGGEDLMNRNGAFIVWRAGDVEVVGVLASSEGFNTADDALKNGIKQGFRYMGVEHYSSNKHAYDVLGGVKKAFMCGIISYLLKL